VIEVFGFLAAFVGILSAIRYQAVCSALADSLPSHFQDGLSSRFAAPAYALHSSTPLKLQADFVKSLAGGVVAMACFALSCYFGERLDGALLASAGAVAVAYSAIKSWMTYRENCHRALTITTGIRADGGA
jgi:hypothetical protein